MLERGGRVVGPVERGKGAGVSCLKGLMCKYWGRIRWDKSVHRLKCSEVIYDRIERLLTVSEYARDRLSREDV